MKSERVARQPRILLEQAVPFRIRRGLNPLHETIDDLLLAGLLEGDGELVAVDLHHMAVAELLVTHPDVQREFRSGAGGFCDQLAFDRQGCALAAGEVAAPRSGI